MFIEMEHLCLVAIKMFGDIFGIIFLNLNIVCINFFLVIYRGRRKGDAGGIPRRK